MTAKTVRDVLMNPPMISRPEKESLFIDIDMDKTMEQIRAVMPSEQEIKASFCKLCQGDKKWCLEDDEDCKKQATAIRELILSKLQ